MVPAIALLVVTLAARLAGWLGWHYTDTWAAATAIAIFVSDIVTPLDVSVATLYVVVVLMAAGFCQPRGIWLVAAGCVGLTLLSFYLTPSALADLQQ